jgi:hypothetical protein
MTKLVEFSQDHEPPRAESGDFAEWWPIEQVIPYDRNPRRNTAAVGPVAESIREFGWQQPLVVDERDVLIVGHTRLLAARSLGLTVVPVRVARGLTKAQVKAYRLADNRTGENAEWDRVLLALEFNDLRLGDFDVALTAFTEQEVEGILGDTDTEGLALDGDPDAATVPQTFLKWGGERIPITDAERDALDARLVEWKARSGALLGFATFLTTPDA